MRKRMAIFHILSLCLVCIFCLSGCNNKEVTKEEKKEKVVQELEYLDTKITEIANSLNNLSNQKFIIDSKEISLKQDENSSSNSQDSNMRTDIFKTRRKSKRREK